MSTLAHAEAGLTGLDQLEQHHDEYAGKAPQHAGKPHSHTTLDSRDGKSLKVRLQLTDMRWDSWSDVSDLTFPPCRSTEQTGPSWTRGEGSEEA